MGFVRITDIKSGKVIQEMGDVPEEIHKTILETYGSSPKAPATGRIEESVEVSKVKFVSEMLSLIAKAKDPIVKETLLATLSQSIIK